MPTHLEWADIGLRLACTLAAGLLIGLNRGEHGRPAGLRTTMLVSLAACVAMILANLLISTEGRRADSYVGLDMMRLPLGILTGMGFIGAGAIMRRDNLVVGVTTAATLWFVTVVGLVFGAGKIWLGAAASVLGFGILTSLTRVERSLKQDRQATLALVAREGGPSDEEIRSAVASAGCRVGSYSIVYEPAGGRREVTCVVEWRARRSETEIPQDIGGLADRPGVERFAWTPQVR